MAAPPTLSSVSSKTCSSAVAAMASRTFTASPTTSGPIPSPPRTAIRKRANLAVDVTDGVEDAVGGATAVLGDQHQVFVGDLFLVVGQALEAGERVVQLVLRQQQAEFFEAPPQRVPARVLAQHKPRPFGADGRRGHDLVRARVLEHAILMDAALVSEGVEPHDRLVRLHGNARELLEQLAGRHQLLEVDAVLDPMVIAADGERHYQLFQGGVAGPFADAVDTAFDLSRAGPAGRQAAGAR